MGDLTLIVLNNTIVGLRKPIAKAEVHIIHKLSRQAKGLRSKKTTTSEETGQRHKIQNDRKADRFGKEICILSKTKKKDAALFVLDNVDHWLPELPRNLTEYNDGAKNDGEDSKEKEKALEVALRKRVLIRLANHTEIKKFVTKFREEYPNWKEKLPAIIPVLGTKQRQKEEKSKSKRRQEERKRRKERVINSKTSKNNLIDTTKELNSENVDLKSTDQDEFGSESGENDDTEEEIGDESDDGKVSVEDDESDDGEVSDEDIVIFDPKINRNSNDLSVLTSDSESNDMSVQYHTANDATLQNTDSSDQEPEIILKFGKDSAPSFEKREGEMVITRLNLNGPNIESFSTENEDQQPGEIHDAKSTENNVKDSFFLGGVSDSPSESEEENTPLKNTNINDTRNRHQRRNDFFHDGKNSDNRSWKNSRKDMDRESQQFNNGVRGREKSRGNSIIEGTRGRGRGRENNFKENIRGRGRGRENNFSGRGRAENSYRNNYSSNADRGKDFNGGSNKNTFVKDHITGVNNDKNIHPSWAAKKKFANSANIVPMGKKIKFNDDGDEQAPMPQNQNRIHATPRFSVHNSSVAPKVPSLHPSWAAKKEQKGIKEFAGKKTVFGDDD